MASSLYCVGIDVSKDTLDGCGLPEPSRRPLPNTAAGHAGIVAQLLPLVQAGTAILVVVEATGGYERPLHAALPTAGVACAIVNPKRVRDFARSKGWLAKTDRLDARMLQAFGAENRPRVTPLPSPARGALAERLAYREQRQAEITVRRQHLRRFADPAVRARAAAALDALVAECADVAAEIGASVTREPEFAERAKVLMSFCGVGVLTAAMLPTHLPELGQITGKQAASLAGLAPFACDSGTLRGQRHIYGGRAKVRCALFHIARIGLRHNPTLKAFYERLVAHAKPGKVALTACMHKALLILNAMLKNGTDWNGAKTTTEEKVAPA